MPAPRIIAAGATWRTTTAALFTYSSSTAGTQPGPVNAAELSTKSTARKIATTPASAPRNAASVRRAT